MPPDAPAPPETSSSPAYLAGRAAFPALALGEARFEAFLRERGLDAAALPDERAADCFLACATLARVPGAAAALTARHEPTLREALRRARLAPDQADDVVQSLWATLLAGEGARLGEWRGQGHLAGFLRVSAVRLALKTRRGQAKQASDDELLDAHAPDLSPELAYLKESYRAAFRAAFQEALDSLPSRDQLLLRQHLLDALTVDELGATYGVHRATAARWLAQARETLVARTRKKFLASTSLSAEEGEGVISLVRSRLDETIRRRLSSAG